MRKRQKLALISGRKIKTIIGRYKENPENGEGGIEYFPAMMSFDTQTMTAKYDVNERRPLSMQKVIDFTKTKRRQKSIATRKENQMNSPKKADVTITTVTRKINRLNTEQKPNAKGGSLLNVGRKLVKLLIGMGFKKS